MQWPVAMLEEELWLRARRRFLLGLEERRLVPSFEEFRSGQEALRTLGQELLDRLGGAMEPRALGYLESDEIGGSFNWRFVTRLPDTLAFGAAFLRWLCLLGDVAEVDARDAAEAAARFNLLAVVADLVADRRQEAALLHRLLPGERLAALSESEEAVSDLARDVAEMPDGELRVFGALLCVFFRSVHRLRARATAAAARSLTDALTRAWEVELLSASQTGETTALATDRSVVVFEVFGRLASLAAGGRSDRLIARSANLTGRAVAAVDDLVDIGQDLANGDLNAVLVAASTDRPPEDAAEHREALVRLLDGDAIEKVAEDGLTAVSSLLAELEASAVPEEIRAQWRNWAAQTLVGWMR
jgi:hypothetical protein